MVKDVALEGFSGNPVSKATSICDQSELQATSTIEKRYCAVFELTSNNPFRSVPFRCQAEAVAVEEKQISQGPQRRASTCYLGFHAKTPTSVAHTMHAHFSLGLQENSGKTHIHGGWANLPEPNLF